MTKLYAITIFFGAVSLVITAVGASKSKNAVSKALSSSVCGIGMLGVLALLAPFSGITISLNWFTSFIAVVLGAPGVITMLVLRVLLGVA